MRKRILSKLIRYLKGRRNLILYLFMTLFVPLCILTLLSVVNMRSIAQQPEVETDLVTVVASFPFGEVTETHSLPCESMRTMTGNGYEFTQVGEVDHTTGLFQMWAYPTNGYGPQTIVSKVTVQGVCGLAYSRGDEHLTDRVPLEVARDLMLQYFTVIADSQGGVEQYQANITASFNEPPESSFDPPETEPSPVEIDSVTKWAYDQLGIQFPEGYYTVRDIDNEWDYSETSDPVTGEQRL